MNVKLPSANAILVFGSFTGFRCIGGRARNQDETAVFAAAASHHHHRPHRSHRPTRRPSATERELALANPMSQLDSGKRDRRVVERFEARHGSAPSLDRPVVLLDDVVEVLAGSNFHVAPDRMLSPQSPHSAPTRHMAVESTFARTARMRGSCLPEERLCCGDATVGSQQEVDRLALLVDGGVQVVPAAMDGDVSLIHTPRSADRSSETVRALRELGHVSDHPSHDGRVRHSDAAIGHQLDEVAMTTVDR
jgi:hypothetical protein